MTDEVRHPGKHFGHRRQDGLSHVVNQRQRNAEGLLNALKERHDVQIRTTSRARNRPTCSVLTVRIRVLLTFSFPAQSGQCVMDELNCTTGGLAKSRDMDTPPSRRFR